MRDINKIEVSVIVPIYNAEKYLCKCIESILVQTYKNMEIICVDDGSTDKSAEIIKSYQKVDKRIKLIQQKNLYAGVARNHGLDVAKGEYIIFLDADDYFEQTLVEKMLSAIYERNADIVICRSRGIDDQSKKKHELAGALNIDLLPKKDVFSKRDIPERIFQLTAGWAWDKMYRTKFLIEKKLRFQEIRAAEDELFVDLSLSEAEAITVVKEVLVTHRTNVVSSLEYKKDQFWYCGYEMLITEKNELVKRGFFQALEKSFVNRAASYIVWYACSIVTPQFFSEFYTYFHEKAIKELGLLDYTEEYYDDLSVYEIIRKIGSYSEREFLCSRIRELNHTVQDLLERMKWMQKGKRWVLPEDFMLNDARIILYGFGDVGRDWYRELQELENMELVMVVDRNYEKFEGNAVKIHPVEDIGKVEYDYILVAIIEKSIAEAVGRDLVKLSVSPEKIIWFDPSEQEM